MPLELIAVVFAVSAAWAVVMCSVVRAYSRASESQIRESLRLIETTIRIAQQQSKESSDSIIEVVGTVTAALQKSHDRILARDQQLDRIQNESHRWEQLDPRTNGMPYTAPVPGDEVG